MRTRTNGPLFALLPLVALAGCAGDNMGLGSASDLGEATRQTFAAQVIDPMPEYASEQQTDGQHVAEAIERYDTDKVKLPDRTSTSDLQTSGGK